MREEFGAYDDERYVMSYDGKVLWKGDLYELSDAIEKEMNASGKFAMIAFETLEEYGIEDVDPDDFRDVARTLAEMIRSDIEDAMYDEGLGYFEYMGFEVFPESELAEGFKRNRLAKTRKESASRQRIGRSKQRRFTEETSDMANKFSTEAASFDYECGSASFAAETLAKALMKKAKKIKFTGSIEERYEQAAAAREWVMNLAKDLRNAISDINNGTLGNRY